MKTYPKYKPSGVEWIGDIPEHWNLIKLRHVALINPSKESAKLRNDSEQIVTFLPMEMVSENSIINQQEKRAIKEVWNGFTYFKRDDVIIAKITPCFENGKGALLDNLDSEVGFGSTEFHVIRVKQEKILKEYLYFATKSNQFKKFGEAFMSGAAGQKRVPQSFIEDFLICLPVSIEEQKNLTKYLKEKIDIIDSLISKKQKLIDLLKEERAALINQAVTKGLNPDVPMKDSGIEWLGEIPEHWEVLTMKNISRLRQGLQIPIQDRYTESFEGSYEYLTIKSIHNPNDYKEYIKNPSKRVVCIDSDVLVARTGATGEIITNVSGVFHNNFFLVDYDRKKIFKEYLYHYLSMTSIKELLLMLAGTTTIPDLNHNDFLNTHMLLPSMAEQKEISIFLEQQINNNIHIISNIEKEIILLQEYRTALISEVVTGKIDVRSYNNEQRYKNAEVLCESSPCGDYSRMG